MKPINPIYYDGTGRQHVVIGAAFGGMLIAFASDPQEALAEFDERFGERVDADDSALDDYPGLTIEERIETAMSRDDIRMTGGGTAVWVDPYEWMKVFTDPRAAMRCFLDRSKATV
jgi:hypothetical protein